MESPMPRLFQSLPLWSTVFPSLPLPLLLRFPFSLFTMPLSYIQFPSQFFIQFHSQLLLPKHLLPFLLLLLLHQFQPIFQLQFSLLPQLLFHWLPLFLLLP